MELKRFLIVTAVVGCVLAGGFWAVVRGPLNPYSEISMVKSERMQELDMVGTGEMELQISNVADMDLASQWLGEQFYIEVLADGTALGSRGAKGFLWDDPYMEYISNAAGAETWTYLGEGWEIGATERMRAEGSVIGSNQYTLTAAITIFGLAVFCGWVLSINKSVKSTGNVLPKRKAEITEVESDKPELVEPESVEPESVEPEPEPEPTKVTVMPASAKPVVPNPSTTKTASNKSPVKGKKDDNKPDIDPAALAASMSSKLTTTREKLGQRKTTHNAQVAVNKNQITKS